MVRANHLLHLNFGGAADAPLAKAQNGSRTQQIVLYRRVLNHRSKQPYMVVLTRPISTTATHKKSAYKSVSNEPLHCRTKASSTRHHQMGPRISSSTFNWEQTSWGNLCPERRLRTCAAVLPDRAGNGFRWWIVPIRTTTFALPRRITGQSETSYLC